MRTLGAEKRGFAASQFRARAVDFIGENVPLRTAFDFEVDRARKVDPIARYGHVNVGNTLAQGYKRFRAFLLSVNMKKEKDFHPSPCPASG